MLSNFGTEFVQKSDLINNFHESSSIKPTEASSQRTVGKEPTIFKKRVLSIGASDKKSQSRYLNKGNLSSIENLNMSPDQVKSVTRFPSI
jgi:hypothetical protein